MSNWKLTQYAYGAFAIVVLILAYFYIKVGGQYAYKQGIDDFNHFHKTGIAGKITYLGIAHHLKAFKVNSDNNLFIVSRIRIIETVQMISSMTFVK